ncbi:hypothetical protein BG004_001213, partial [Podila humilis]
MSLFFTATSLKRKSTNVHQEQDDYTSTKRIIPVRSFVHGPSHSSITFMRPNVGPVISVDTTKHVRFDAVSQVIKEEEDEEEKTHVLNSDKGQGQEQELDQEQDQDPEEQYEDQDQEELETVSNDSTPVEERKDATKTTATPTENPTSTSTKLESTLSSPLTRSNGSDGYSLVMKLVFLGGMRVTEVWGDEHGKRPRKEKGWKDLCDLLNTIKSLKSLEATAAALGAIADGNINNYNYSNTTNNNNDDDDGNNNNTNTTNSKKNNNERNTTPKKMFGIMTVASCRLRWRILSTEYETLLSEGIWPDNDIHSVHQFYLELEEQFHRQFICAGGISGAKRSRRAVFIKMPRYAETCRLPNTLHQMQERISHQGGASSTSSSSSSLTSTSKPNERIMAIMLESESDTEQHQKTPGPSSSPSLASSTISSTTPAPSITTAIPKPITAAPSRPNQAGAKVGTMQDVVMNQLALAQAMVNQQQSHKQLIDFMKEDREERQKAEQARFQRDQDLQSLQRHQHAEFLKSIEAQLAARERLIQLQAENTQRLLQ